jgi:hypothetical protein
VQVRLLPAALLPKSLGLFTGVVISSFDGLDDNRATFFAPGARRRNGARGRINQIKQEREILQARYALYRGTAGILRVIFIALMPLLAIGASTVSPEVRTDGAEDSRAYVATFAGGGAATADQSFATGADDDRRCALSRLDSPHDQRRVSGRVMHLAREGVSRADHRRVRANRRVLCCTRQASALTLRGPEGGCVSTPSGPIEPICLRALLAGVSGYWKFTSAATFDHF